MKKTKFTLFSAFELVVKEAPKTSMLIILITFISGVLPSFLVRAEQNFIDLGVEMIKQRVLAYNVFIAIGLVIFILILDWVIQIVTRIAKINQEAKVKYFIHNKLFEKINKTEYSTIEQSDIQNLTTRVMDKPERHLGNIIDNILLLLRYCVVVVSLFILLFTQIKFKALIILIVSFLLFIIARKSGKSTYQLERENSLDKRTRDYYQDILISKEFVEERNTYNYGDFIQNKWHNISNTVIKKESKLSAKWFASRKIGSIMLLGISFFVIFMLIQPVLQGQVTIGFSISYIHATFNLSKTVSRLLTDIIEKLYKEGEYCKDITEFMTLSETKTDNIILDEAIYKIEFDDVSFTYPNAKTPTLSHVSFTLNKEKQYALVGINGAGKTTLVKLITGFYDSYTGSIRVNDIELKNINKGSLKKLFSTVNQDFAQYQISIEENLGLGHDNSTYDLDEATDVLNKLYLDHVIERLPDGVKTEIGKIHETGVDLSQGEWQKLAIARALLQSSSVLLLDEPTASLDPLAEAEVYSDFTKASKGRLTLLISHRLGATKSADEIILLSNGAILDKGSHDTLYKQCDLYKDMYNKQKSWYSL